ncbi:MAG: hypothetical protein K2I81_03525 [Alphaproteobacteria bacterium]|nr:hypothetical protein [Alphaproteobacteria bacterium]
MRWGLFIFCLIFSTTAAHAKHKIFEREYVSKYCKGAIEYVLPDRTRVDCLTNEYAIEFDFASKWGQAIGQSLHYAHMTRRLPAIYLILESKKDMRFVEILTPLCNVYGIKLFLIENY